jgi:outer membrane lipoprotein SlyB
MQIKGGLIGAVGGAVVGGVAGVAIHHVKVI